MEVCQGRVLKGKEHKANCVRNPSSSKCGRPQKHLDFLPEEFDIAHQIQLSEIVLDRLLSPDKVGVRLNADPVERKQPVPKNTLCHSILLDIRIHSLEVKQLIEFRQGTEQGSSSRFRRNRFSTLVVAIAAAAFLVE